MTAYQALALAIQAGTPTPAIEHAILQDSACVVMYGRKYPRHPWPSAEQVILASDDVARMIEYAKSVVRGRWPVAEQAIAKDPDETLHAKYTDLLTAADMDEEWAVKCPCWLSTYADKVIRGKLPEHLHNRMVAFGTVPPASPFLTQYFDKLTVVGGS